MKGTKRPKNWLKHNKWRQNIMKGTKRSKKIEIYKSKKKRKGKNQEIANTQWKELRHNEKN
jgi:hypothetical protein